MKKWWSLQHVATRECVIMGICCLIACCSLFLRDSTQADPSLNNPLLQKSTSYRVYSELGNYSLLFQQQIALLGDDVFNAVARLKPSEQEDLQRSLHETQIIRNLGRAQLDQEQQESYGFNDGIRVDAPGQEAWTIATGQNKHGYALDTSGNLYQLDRDLASQLRRSPNALRDNTLGIPSNLTRIQNQITGKEWTLGFIRNHWWLDNGEHASLCDQRICNDWLTVFQESNAISFDQHNTQLKTPHLLFEGQNKFGTQVIALYDGGHAAGSKEFRIIERHQQIGKTLLKEAFVMDIDKQLFQFPKTAFLSKNLIPFSLDDCKAISIGSVILNKVQGIWFVDGTIYANQNKVLTLIKDLQALPADNKKYTQNVGQIRQQHIEFNIPASPQAKKLSEDYKRFRLIDKRLFPQHNAQEMTGIVIHSQDDVPQLYQRQDDNSWDIDPEVNEGISEFIDALSAARVRAWQAFDSKQQWTSTLTIAIGDKRIILKKTDQHLIGIADLKIQGYLDQASITDLFGE